MKVLVGKHVSLLSDVYEYGDLVCGSGTSGIVIQYPWAMNERFAWVEFDQPKLYDGYAISLDQLEVTDESLS